MYIPRSSMESRCTPPHRGRFNIMWCGGGVGVRRGQIEWCGIGDVQMNVSAWIWSCMDFERPVSRWFDNLLVCWHMTLTTR